MNLEAIKIPKFALIVANGIKVAPMIRYCPVMVHLRPHLAPVTPDKSDPKTIPKIMMVTTAAISVRVQSMDSSASTW